MRRSKPSVNTAISFVESFDDFPAQGQELFIRRQGHGSILRPVIYLLPPTRLAAEINAIGRKPRLALINRVWEW